MTARAPWKRAGGDSLFPRLARPCVTDYYQGRERSSSLLGVTQKLILLRSTEVVPLRIWKASKLGIGSIVVEVVRANLSDSPFAHHVPLGPTHNHSPRRSLRRPEATPFTHNFVVASDDVVDAPHRLQKIFEFSPVLREMLCSAYRGEAGGQEVMNHVRIEGTEQNIKIAGVTPIVEVPQYDRDVVCFAQGHRLLLSSVLRCVRVMRGA